tara:strand:+ start:406 stop:1575 length:1170 start_codon:yes stop_codon:yes gene_type:complete
MIILLQVSIRVALVTLLSMAFPLTVAAHEVQPAVADIEIGTESVTITLRTSVEPLIVGVNLSEVADTDESPLADQNDALRALAPSELASALDAAWPEIAMDITLQSGGVDLPLTLTSVDIPSVGDTRIRRDSTLILTADLPVGKDPVVFGWDAKLGGLIIRQVATGSEDAYETYLTNGALSDPMPRTGVAQQSLGDVIDRYIVSGFDHIIPKGMDHMLFVLGLFFYALAWRPLLWQVTAFTAAHTVTLALASLGIVSVPASIVEPLIAASIIWVAIENVWKGGTRDIGWPRIAVVFGFGLLHGLGFASVLSQFGLGNQFVASLISFNVGVEIGQLTVIAVAFLLLGLPFGSRPFYRRAIAIPGSLVIATIAAYWFLNRVGVLGDLPYLT